MRDIVQIRPLTTEDAAAFHALRLRSLREHPEAFGTAEEDEQGMTLDQRERQLSDPTGHSLMFGAWHDGELVGMLHMARHTRRKVRHRAMLGSMYVAPEARRLGAGRALLDAALAHARSMEGLEDVTLAVTVGNEAARRLYLSAGFVPYGIEPRYIRDGDTYFDIEWMYLHLQH